MNKSKIAVYVRISTTDQESGLESQKRAIQRWLKGHDIAKAEWFEDRISGVTDKRPGLDRLHRSIFNGETKTVVCWSLSRLTRKGAFEGLTLLARWLEKKVRVVAISEQFDFAGASGELVAAVLFSIARMQRDQLSESTKRGLALAKERGVKLGKRPGKWTQDVKPLHDQGMKPADIARKLGRSRQAVHNVIKGVTPIYPGP
jgi:DNA invertase Pin-like site-specific DNA recombinase